ncbi:MAG: hypothetical protein ACXW1B_03665 [Nitrososphaeraceae archaeon]
MLEYTRVKIQNGLEFEGRMKSLFPTYTFTICSMHPIKKDTLYFNVFVESSDPNKRGVKRATYWYSLKDKKHGWTKQDLPELASDETFKSVLHHSVETMVNSMVIPE